MLQLHISFAPPRKNLQSLQVLLFVAVLVSFSNVLLLNPSLEQTAPSSIDVSFKTHNRKNELEPFFYSQPYEYIIPADADNDIQMHVGEAVAIPNSTSANPLDNCTVTNQVRIEVNATGHWLLHSLHFGQPKRYGGDDFYIVYEDYADPNYDKNGTSPTAVANISYIGDGTYYLDFVEPPMRNAMLPKEERRPYGASGMGRLKVYFVYTCFIGAWGYTGKNQFRNNGSSRTVHTLHNVTFPRLVRPFQLPPMLDSRNGGINLGGYDNVICFGDSVLRTMFGMHTINPCPVDFHKSNVIYFPHPQMKFSSETKHTVLRSFDEASETHPQIYNGSTALVMTSFSWDLLLPYEPRLDPNIDDHILAVRDILTTIRQRYPHFTIYWKSPHALHAHRLEEICYKRGNACTTRCLRMSDHYVRDIHQRQKELMQELDIPFLDVYDLSYMSGEWHVQGDGIHYRKEFNMALLNLTYPQGYPDSNIDQCKNHTT